MGFVATRVAREVRRAHLRENVGSIFRHAPDQRGEPRVHLRRWEAMAATMPRENPFKVIIEQPGQRLPLLLPGVPAEITKRVEVVVGEAPSETVAGEEATSRQR